MARRRQRQLELPVPPTGVDGDQALAASLPPRDLGGRTRVVPSTIHATLFMSRSAASLPSRPSARRNSFPHLQRALAASSDDSFRVLHFSVQSDHLHLIVEADSGPERARGIQRLAVRCARAVNRALGRCGTVWAQRYHCHPLRTPREVRVALVYVLLNFRKHLRAAPGIDPRSSGAWFDGWAREATPPATPPCPVGPPRTWLASIGWRRGGGLIDGRETPPAARS